MDWNEYFWYRAKRLASYKESVGFVIPTFFNKVASLLSLHFALVHGPTAFAKNYSAKERSKPADKNDYAF